MTGPATSPSAPVIECDEDVVIQVLTFHGEWVDHEVYDDETAGRSGLADLNRLYEHVVKFRLVYRQTKITVLEQNAPSICHECKKKPDGPHRHWCSFYEDDWTEIDAVLTGGSTPEPDSAPATSAPPTCPVHGELLSGGDQCWTCFADAGGAS